MELRHIRYFVAVARCEHMRQAAERLHIAQPALSRQIADLEEEMGCPLFDRLPRRIRLNAAGQSLLHDAEQILAAVDTATNNARRASRGETGSIKIGFIESASWAGLFPTVIQKYRSKNPGVDLALLPMYSRAQLEAIKADQIDAGFCYALEAMPDECSSIHIGTDTVLLAAPRRYGWKTRKDLKLVDLVDEPFVWISREQAPTYHDLLLRAVIGAGVSPRIVQQTFDENTMLSLVSAGMGLGLVNSALSERKPRSVDFVRVVDLNLLLPLHFVWRSDNLSPSLVKFLQLIKPM